MEEKEIVTIPFVAHESSMQRMERANRRLFIIILIMIVGFMIYLFEEAETPQQKQMLRETLQKSMM